MKRHFNSQEEYDKSIAQKAIEQGIVEPVVKFIKGEPGKDAVITEQMLQDVARRAAKLVEVPVVEKVIERTEVIKEQPIVKEVQVFDTKNLEKKINEVIKNQLTIEDIVAGLKKFAGAVIRWDQISGKPIAQFGKDKKVIHRGGGTSSSVMAYDLSSELDGVLKTFTIPSNTRVLSVMGSSFPNIFRPTTDYTYTSTTITFTSEISAATTLAAGQTITILYVES